MNKERLKVYIKYDMKCAYCGKKLSKRFHIDHINPKYLGGNDTLKNMNPSCPRCNIRKNTLSIEQFRNEISEQVNRLRKNNNQFRLAEDFGLIQETNNKVVFWFEKCKDIN